VLRATAYLAASLLVMALAIAGCGGRDGDDTASGGDTTTNTAASGETSNKQESNSSAPDKPVAKAAFVKKANAICDKTVERVASLALPAIQQKTNESGRSQEEVEVEFAQVSMAPELRREVRLIRDIGTPRGDQAKVDAILAAILEVAEEAEQNPKAVIQRGSSTFDKPSQLADSYGLRSCPYG